MAPHHALPAVGKPFDLRRYFVRRFWRIYPAHLVILPLGCCALLVRLAPVTRGDAAWPPPW